MAPFNRFTCGGITDKIQYCYKYQLRDYESEWSAGNVRFEAGQRVYYYLMSAVGWKAIYGLFEGEIVLLGSEALAAGLALAAVASTLSF